MPASLTRIIPRWSSKAGSRVWVSRLLSRLSGLQALQHIYKSIGPTQGPVDFASRALIKLGIEVSSCEKSLNRLPDTGPIVIVANHPFGTLDGLAAIHLVGAQRPDVWVLANAELTSIPELAAIVLPLDHFDGRGSTQRNAQSLRKAWRWLNQGHALVIFPAGAVARFDARAGCVTDPPWSPTISRLVRKSAAPVVPLHFSGQNSAWFQIAGLMSSRLRNLLMPSELLRRMNTRVDAQLGEPITNRRIGQFNSPEALALHLRLKTFLVPSMNSIPVVGSMPTTPRLLEDLAAAMPANCLQQEVSRLPPQAKLFTKCGMEVYLTDADDIPFCLSEISRLRELSTRSIGEGSGRGRDIDHYNGHCEHLFIWNAESRQIVGAYRVTRTDQVTRRHGRQGLQNSAMFTYRKPFYSLLGPALELGLPFVRLEYQCSSTPLLLLWKGIGELVARNPRYTKILGPMHVSGEYSETSRNLLVEFLHGQCFDSLLGGLVQARNPFHRPHSMGALTSELAMLGAIEPLAALVEELEPDGKGIPALLNQYLKLGARVLAFNVDARSGKAIDCLMLVDLNRRDPQALLKYIRTSAG